MLLDAPKRASQLEISPAHISPAFECAGSDGDLFVEFAESHLRLFDTSAAGTAGQPVRIRESQRLIVDCLLAFDDAGLPVFGTAYLQGSKKCGKSFLLYVDPDSIAVVGTGDPVPSSLFSTYADNSEFLARPPGCIVWREASQSIGNATFSEIAFNSPDIRDTDGFHSTATNNGRMTVPTGLGGLYMVGANVGWDSSPTGHRIVRLRKNGTTLIGTVDGPSSPTGFAPFQNVNTVAFLNAGDYVEVIVWQNSGGALSTFSGTVGIQSAWMHLIAVS